MGERQGSIVIEECPDPTRVRIRPQHGWASGRRYSRIAYVTGVDEEQTLENETLQELPSGALIVIYDPRGSVQYGHTSARLVRVTSDGESEIDSIEDCRRDRLLLRDAIARALDDDETRPDLSNVSDAELLAEIRRRGIET